MKIENFEAETSHALQVLFGTRMILVCFILIFYRFPIDSSDTKSFSRAPVRCKEINKEWLWFPRNQL